ncbi:hypothetical protein Tco_1310379 [Tanacetum coccineum]
MASKAEIRQSSSCSSSELGKAKRKFSTLRLPELKKTVSTLPHGLLWSNGVKALRERSMFRIVDDYSDILRTLLRDGENLDKTDDKRWMRFKSVHNVSNVPQVLTPVTTSNELELLYSLMFSELLNGLSVVSKSCCRSDTLTPVDLLTISSAKFSRLKESFIWSQTNTRECMIELQLPGMKDSQKVLLDPTQFYHTWEEYCL